MNPLIQSIKAKLVSVAKKNQLPYEKLFTHFMLERIVSQWLLTIIREQNQQKFYGKMEQLF